MSTPPYAPPSVGPEGLTIAVYQAILEDNLQAFLNIYGLNQYIAPDSAIYQLISMLSLKQSDTNLGLQLDYNQSSPQTAVGAGLDRVVKMNGLARASFTFSTVQLLITGVPGTEIINGFAQDNHGNLWALESPIIILISGSMLVNGVCTTPGSISAQPFTIVIISTPTAGWDTVTNPNSAVLGKPVESDSQLRARQSISVALPAKTPLASTVAAILAVDGVTRVAPGYATPGGPGSSIENPTGSTDFWGNPQHSISMAVEGGTDLDVANAIYRKKTIGCFTNGTTMIPVVDEANGGFTETIGFFRPTYLPIFVLVKIHGYGTTPTTTTLTLIHDAIVDYLNALAIGETVAISAINYEAMAINLHITAPNFGVQVLQIGTAVLTNIMVTTAGSNIITVGTIAGISPGNLIVGAGIPSGTTVISALGLTVTMSANATATSSTAIPVTFSAVDIVDIPMPNFYYVAEGLSPNVSVVIV